MKFAARQSRNRTARSVWSAGDTPAFKRHRTAKAGAYPALQTLRDIRRPAISSQLANTLDYRSAEETQREKTLHRMRDSHLLHCKGAETQGFPMQTDRIMAGQNHAEKKARGSSQ